MTKEHPFSGTFKLDKETKNTVRYAEEEESRRPVVGTVYIDKYELPDPARAGSCFDVAFRFWKSWVRSLAFSRWTFLLIRYELELAPSLVRSPDNG